MILITFDLPAKNKNNASRTRRTFLKAGSSEQLRPCKSFKTRAEVQAYDYAPHVDSS